MSTVSGWAVSPPVRVRVKVALSPSAMDDGVAVRLTRALPLGGSSISTVAS